MRQAPLLCRTLTASARPAVRVHGSSPARPAACARRTALRVSQPPRRLGGCAARVVAAAASEEADAEGNGEGSGEEALEPAPPSPLERLQELAATGADAETLSALAADLGASLAAAHDREAAQAAASAELENAVKGAKDSLLRLNAEFQNFRNRTEREKTEIGDRVKGQVLEELIPLIDNFEAAKQYIKPESEGEKKIEGAYQALYKQMVETFKKMGIEAVQTVGKPFDPAVHEAIGRQPSADVSEDTVVQEFRKGFRIGGRLIRPATVMVAVPEAPQAEAAAEEAPEEGAAEETST